MAVSSSQCLLDVTVVLGFWSLEWVIMIIETFGPAVFVTDAMAIQAEIIAVYKWVILSWMNIN